MGRADLRHGKSASQQIKLELQETHQGSAHHLSRHTRQLRVHGSISHQASQSESHAAPPIVKLIELVRSAVFVERGVQSHAVRSLRASRYGTPHIESRATPVICRKDQQRRWLPR